MVKGNKGLRGASFEVKSTLKIPLKSNADLSTSDFPAENEYFLIISRGVSELESVLYLELNDGLKVKFDLCTYGEETEEAKASSVGKLFRVTNRVAGGFRTAGFER